MLPWLRRRFSRFLAALLLWAVAGSGSADLAQSADGEASARAAQVAGQFYPDDREELRRTVTQLLERAPAPRRAAKPRGLIVPHAGYPFSGPTAAAGFRQIQGHSYDAVVVVGFTHRMPFDGASVDTRPVYRLPLGDLPIDQEAAAFLQGQPGIRHVEEAHANGEHSVEVQLPFLAIALGQTKIVPILMGGADLADAQQLADALAALSRRGDYLFVFSTDLSHYHPYQEARTLDERTVNAILFESPQAVHRLFRYGVLEACGQGPIVTGLLLASRLGYAERELVQSANSGDTAGDRSRVVGYAAIALFDRSGRAASPRLSEEAGSALVAAARQSLERALAKREIPDPVRLDRYPELSQANGVFVTLRKQGELRGCIGRIETTEPLAVSVPVVALDAALRDPRFPPVTAEELPALRVEVSVLTPPAPLQDVTELVPGRDGVTLAYEGRHGVFLPQVWTETGWTRAEFLQELASQKAGLPPDAWQRVALSVFQDQVFEEPPASQ